MAIKLAVSRCLLGEKVRYDGTDKLCSNILIHTSDSFNIVPFCPEVSIGMGTPRLPIRLDKIKKTVHVRQIKDNAYDYTDALKNYALKFSLKHPDLKGVISKKGSPSCGYNNSKLYSEGDVIKYDESGIFISELKNLLPELLIIDELNFEDEFERTKFLNNLIL